MKDTPVILYTSSEACTPGIAKFEDGSEVKVFKSRSGRLHTDEHFARYDGCTHITCPETGEVFEKTRTFGPTVTQRKLRERYLAQPQQELEFPIFADYDFVSDLDDLIDYCILHDLRELPELSIALPCGYRELDPSYFTEDCPEGVDLHLGDEIEDAISDLNTMIKEEGIQYYEGGRGRPTDKQLDEWQEALDRAWEEQR